MRLQLITDSACDLPLEYVKENNIKIASLEVNVKGEFIKDDLGQTLKYKEFYDLLREGEKTSTSQVNIHTFEELFLEYVSKGESVLYIGLSAALSGTYNSAEIARQNVLEQYPDADITVINSKSGAMGEGAFVYYAMEMLKQGKTKKEVVAWVEANCEKMRHEIIVDSLAHLKRGGRISATTAAVGTLLNIKPALKLNKEGSIESVSKIKGKKAVVKYVVKQVKENAVNIEEQIVFVCHADCVEVAEGIKELLLQEVNPKGVIINCVGGVIGTHVGPGAIGVMYLGNER